MPRKRFKLVNTNVNNSEFATYWGEVYYKNFSCFNRYKIIYAYTV